jgi:endo-alpha-1,4-polygalactosaminidase (GH114 family)
MAWRSLAALVLLALVVDPVSAAAQTVPQGAPATDVAALPATPAPYIPTLPIIDYREQMRRFVERVATFARGHRPDFVVVVQNGLDLISKAEDGEEREAAPAESYLRSIDGVLVEALNVGQTELDKPTPEDEHKKRLRLARMARDHGRKILVMDYAKRPETIRKAYRLNQKNRFVSFAADARGPAIVGLPKYPRDPFKENPLSVLSLKDVMNFAYLGDSSALGREDEFAFALHQTNYDMVVVDPFHGRRALGKQAVETLKYKKLGAKRLVLAHLDIATAASYLYYWQPSWNEAPPPWLAEPVPGDPDRYYVEYWRPEWQDIITGSTHSYVYGLIDRGYDGVVIEGLDTYRYFEGDDVFSPTGD